MQQDFEVDDIATEADLGILRTTPVFKRGFDGSIAYVDFMEYQQVGL